MRRPDTSVFLLSPLFRVLPAWMRQTDTSVFPLFLLFSGASCLDAAAGHLGLSAFSSFQGCTWLRWGGRTPRSFRFSSFQGCTWLRWGGRTPRSLCFFLFSGVHMAAMRQPDTSVFPLFPLFRGAHGCDAAAGHLGLYAFSSFQVCYRRYYKSVSIFSGGTISAELRMPDFLEERRRHFVQNCLKIRLERRKSPIAQQSMLFPF